MVYVPLIYLDSLMAFIHVLQIMVLFVKEEKLNVFFFQIPIFAGKNI
jgi:hypothetical protein